MVGNVVKVSPPDSRGDVDVEGGGDHDGGGEAEEEQEGEVIHDELVRLDSTLGGLNHAGIYIQPFQFWFYDTGIVVTIIVNIFGDHSATFNIRMDC